MKRKDKLNDDQLLQMMDETEGRFIPAPKTLYSEDVYTKAIAIVNNLLPEKVKLNPMGELDFRNLINQYGVQKYLDTVADCQKYLVPKDGGEVGEYHINMFINQIYKLIKHIDKSELDKKKAYILGIAKNKFGQFAIGRVAKILDYEILISRNGDWSDEEILEDWDVTFIPHMINSKNWTVFRTGLPEGYPYRD
jgi:hypothetical protein